jgi:hypothetical protein
MSKIFPTLRGTPLSKEEDEYLNRWKHLQKHSRDIVCEAMGLVETGQVPPDSKLYLAVKNYLRLGGKLEDIKQFL